MHISIKTLKGKSINLEVDDSSNTIDLRIHGEPIRELVLGLDPGPDPTPDPGAVMTIFVNTLAGKTIPFRVKGTVTVRKIKAKCEEIDDIPVKEQRLIFQGRLLEDCRTVDYYQIQNGSTLILMSRQCAC